MYVGNHMGFGPKLIGTFIDRSFGFGSNTKIDASDQNIQKVAELTVDDFLKKVSINVESADLFLDNLTELKGSFCKEDIIIALSSVKYNKEIMKTAKPGQISKLLSFLSGNGKSYVSSALYGVIKLFMKGVIAAATIAGISSMFEKDKTIDNSVENKEINSSIKRYTNVSKNVEDTLITFLDATIQNFSGTFEYLNKRKLKGSKEIQNILKR